MPLGRSALGVPPFALGHFESDGFREFWVSSGLSYWGLGLPWGGFVAVLADLFGSIWRSWGVMGRLFGSRERLQSPSSKKTRFFRV